MSTPAPLAVPPQTPRRIDPDDAFRPRSAALLKMELEARRDDIRHHLDGIQHEIASGSGLGLLGRPVPEHLKEKAVRWAGGALAVGLALGLMTGARKRRRAVPDVSDLDLARARASALIDAAALRVARGADPDDAIGRALRATPIVVADPRTPTERRGPGTVKMVMNTLVGVGLKVAADQLTQRLTPHEETIEALKDAAD